MKYLREIVIAGLVIWIAWSNIFKTPETITKTITKVKTDTITVEVKAPPKIEYKDRVVFKEDTTQLAELNALIDSLQNEMNQQEHLGEYVASMDTTLTDSTGNEVGKLSLSVVSRIPFDPELQFLINATMFKTTITNTTTITKGKTFWQRFGVSAQGGFGMGLITKQFDFYVGVGVHFDIL